MEKGDGRVWRRERWGKRGREMSWERKNMRGGKERHNG